MAGPASFPSDHRYPDWGHFHWSPKLAYILHPKKLIFLDPKPGEDGYFAVIVRSLNESNILNLASLVDVVHQGQTMFQQLGVTNDQMDHARQLLRYHLEQSQTNIENEWNATLEGLGLPLDETYWDPKLVQWRDKTAELIAYPEASAEWLQRSADQLASLSGCIVKEFMEETGADKDNYTLGSEHIELLNLFVPNWQGELKAMKRLLKPVDCGILVPDNRTTKNAGYSTTVYEAQIDILDSQTAALFLSLTGGSDAAEFRFLPNPRRDQIKDKLAIASSPIHISTDLWTSPHRHALLAVCAQWVDQDDQLQKALLRLPECRDNHSGERQAGLIMSILETFGITSKLGYHSGDNATSNDTCLESIARRLKDNLNPAVGR
ncbi:hypothetical protein S40293_09905 [Stachybotrys chartarum IBT 40293]|nr:hypothetical protein S40293_09905 [Stachybotrys chartarum IBT 40293]